jgi:pSer/pThr/pTyr-binding forkhead associated (FHA) protein
VGVLQAFERRLGGLVEGAFAKVFKGDVQPVEIAGALQRETDNRKNIVGQGKVLVPNEFTVELGDHDHERLAEWAEPLGDELADMVRDHAAERGYSFIGPVQVGFEHVPEVGTGVFRIRSAAVAGEIPPEPVAPVRSPTEPATTEQPPRTASTQFAGRPRLIVAAGAAESSYQLRDAVTVIGRANESGLRLEDPGVSRRHAEMRISGSEAEIVDLGSTNGIRVNGRSVPSARLLDGDRIDLGSTSLVFRRDEG